MGTFLESRSDCLIGYSGFVGSNLQRQHVFQDLYRSTNIEDIRGKQYDLIVCAGAPAAKWKANLDPAADRRGIDDLIDNLAQARAARLILISTVDVYPVTHGVDESFDCGREPNHAYGKNRLYLECRLKELFSDVRIIRLPGLFGPGLKKNVIYDLLHNNCLDAINPDSIFQYYDTTELWRDIEKIQKQDVDLVNLVTEPIMTGRILEAYFPGKVVGGAASAPVAYDIRSVHAEKLGGQNGYCRSAAEVLERFGLFLKTQASS